jgi:hypothetical protein
METLNTKGNAAWICETCIPAKGEKMMTEYCLENIFSTKALIKMTREAAERFLQEKPIPKYGWFCDACGTWHINKEKPPNWEDLDSAKKLKEREQ